jgi:hypothetical protein
MRFTMTWLCQYRAASDNAVLAVGDVEDDALLARVGVHHEELLVGVELIDHPGVDGPAVAGDGGTGVAVSGEGGDEVVATSC